MRYLNAEGVGADWTSPDCPNSWVMEYSLDKGDYFCNFRMMWSSIVGKCFEFRVSTNKTIKIPSGFYVLIGDVYGEIDWIMADELIGRSVEIVLFSDNLEHWKLEVPELVGVEEINAYWPRTKNIIPLSSQGNVVLLSDKDQYQKTKNEIVTSLVV